MLAVEHVMWGVLCAWLTLVVETVVVLCVSHAQLTSVWEVQFGLLCLAPMALFVTGVAGGVGGLGVSLLKLTQPGWVGRAVAAAVAGAGAGLLGYGVGGGRHFAATGMRAGLSGAFFVVGASAAYLLIPPLARLVKRRPGAVAVAAAGLVVACELVNQWVLVRLYPAFHWALFAAALLLSAALSSGWPAGYQPRRRRVLVSLAVTTVVLLGCGAGAVTGAESLGRFDNFRLILLERAPIAGRVVELAARVAPPPPTALVDVDEGAPGTGRAAGFSLAGRDILLLTVDALRADHVGAYGYAVGTTPNIDRLAREGVRFEFAYAPTPHTSYSIVSLMTGKYMRPLLLQGAGLDSETWPVFLRRYGYRTAAFYPPAVFFIDASRFQSFEQSGLGFEYSKVEFAEGPQRLGQVQTYLEERTSDRPLFLWVHSFLPHEPYEKHAGFDFGDRDVDRYDSEIALADDTIGKLVATFRTKSPKGMVIVAADHGEEFGEHGGRYHGTTVYEEQIRVPLVINAPDLLSPAVVREPVQTIDLLPTVLSALDIPRPPRLRGRDLSQLAVGKASPGAGLALAETEDQLLLAQGTMRLVCQRQIGACRLFDLQRDPGEKEDVSSEQAGRMREMQRLIHQLSASHGEFETQGLRAEGKGWPGPILRAVAGDADAADELAQLLDDADARIRRKSAELLFELARESTVESLVLTLGRDEDPEVRAWLALALTRLGKGAPLVYDLYASNDTRWRRLASLALAESGDRRGIAVLIDWWKDKAERSYSRSRQLLFALARVRAKDAVPTLLADLSDVRLRPHIAAALAEIGEKAAIGPLVTAFSHERYQTARVALADALTRLGAEEELAHPLTRFLGVPDPLPSGLLYAMKAKVLQYVGGPDPRSQTKLARDAANGVVVTLFIPKGGNGTGLRAILRAANAGSEPGEVRLAPASRSRIGFSDNTSKVLRQDIGKKDELEASRVVVFSVPPRTLATDTAVAIPPAMGFGEGRSVEVTILATSGVRVEAVAIVPLADEFPAPAPQPWRREGETPPAHAVPPNQVL